MEIHLISPIYAFLLSILLGVILSIFFDFFKILNIAFEFNKIILFIQDVLYFFSSGIMTFIFLLAFNNGKISFFIILGEIIGWTLWHIGFGNRATYFISKKIYLLKKVLHHIKVKVLNLKEKFKTLLVKPKSWILKRDKNKTKQKEN